MRFLRENKGPLLVASVAAMVILLGTASFDIMSGKGPAGLSQKGRIGFVSAPRRLTCDSLLSPICGDGERLTWERVLAMVDVKTTTGN